MKPGRASRPPDSRDLLAAEAVTVAVHLVGLVRNADRAAIGAFFKGLDLTEERWYALAVMLACMVDDRRTVPDMLAWMTWTDPSQPIASTGRGNPLAPWIPPDASPHRFDSVPLQQSADTATQQAPQPGASRLAASPPTTPKASQGAI